MGSGGRVDPRQSATAVAWKQWIPALVWLGIIAFESTDFLSSEHTGSILYSLVTRLLGQINPFAFMEWHHYLRKGGHVVGYAILSYLLFRAWRATLPRRLPVSWSLYWASIAFVMTALVASLDEWHQSFIPSRTGTFHDVLLDSSAAVVAQGLLWFFLRNKRSQPGATLSGGTAASRKTDAEVKAAEV